MNADPRLTLTREHLHIAAKLLEGHRGHGIPSEDINRTMLHFRAVLIAVDGGPERALSVN